MKVEVHKNRRRRRWGFLLVVSLLAGATYVLGWSSVFSVKQVVVLGAPSSAESLLIRNSVQIGDKLARLEPKNLNTTLNAFPWLDRSTVNRNWFKGVVTIHVWTRTPVAIANGKLIDNSGKIFELPDNNGRGLPKIVASSPTARLFAVKLINDLPAQLRDSLQTVTTSGSHFALLHVMEKSFAPPRLVSIKWGDLSNSVLKGRVYYSLIALPENRKISLVDVSAPHAPIVK
jgi:cell division septal protein FtsQ